MKKIIKTITPRAIQYPVVFIFSLAMPLIASAYLFESDPEYLFNTAAWAIRWIISLLLGVATLVFFWGVIQYVISQGDETKLKAGKKYMVWGIIGLVVIASAWGITNLIIFTMFGETAFSVPGLGSDFGGGGLGRTPAQQCAGLSGAWKDACLAGTLVGPLLDACRNVGICP